MKAIYFLIVYSIIVQAAQAIEIRFDRNSVISTKNLSSLSEASEKTWSTSATVRTTRGPLEKIRLHYARGSDVIVIEMLDGKVSRIGKSSVGKAEARDNYFEEEKKISYFSWTTSGTMFLDLEKSGWSVSVLSSASK